MIKIRTFLLGVIWSVSFAGWLFGSAIDFDPDSAESVVRDFAKDADRILLCSQKESVFIPIDDYPIAKYVRIFRVIHSLRGEIPRNAILRYSDHYSENRIPDGASIVFDKFTGTRKVASTNLSGELFFVFLKAEHLREIGVNEFEYDICGDGPFWGNPLPANDAGMMSALRTVLPQFQPLMRIDSDKIKVEEKDFPISREIRKSIAEAEDVLLATLSSEKIFWNTKKKQWERERIFRIAVSAYGKIPFGEELRVTDFLSDDSLEFPEFAIGSKDLESRRICLKNNALLGELFYLFPLKGKIVPSDSALTFYRYDELRSAPAIPMFPYQSDAHRLILEKFLIK